MPLPEDQVRIYPAQDAAGRSYQTKVGGVGGEGDKLCPSCEARYALSFNACPRDGTALVTTDDTVGTTLSGTYFVRRVLGEGAMGQVFEARHTRIPAKRFAVKMLHPEYLRQPQNPRPLRAGGRGRGVAPAPPRGQHRRRRPHARRATLPRHRAARGQGASAST